MKRREKRKADWDVGRLAVAGLLAAVCLAGAAASEERRGRLLGVRSSVQGPWLRIVFDLSEEIPYRVWLRPQSGERSELAFEFSGLTSSGAPERVKLPGPGGLTLALERPAGRELLARLPLFDRRIRYRHFTLADPPRVVVDLSFPGPLPGTPVDFNTGPFLLSPTRVARPAAPPGPPERKTLRLARLSPMAIAPPLREERLAPVVRGTPGERQGTPPGAPEDSPPALTQKVGEWRPLFERPPLPEPREGEGGAAEFREALRHYTEGRLAEAAEAFKAFVRGFPKSRLAPAAAYLAGDSLFERKPDSKEKAKVPDNDKRPSAPREERPRGQRWFHQATAAYRQALREYPSADWMPWGLFQLGRSESELGLYFRAESTFQDLLERYPDHPLTALALAHQGFTNLKLGDAGLAEEIFRRALRHPRAGSHARALARYGLGGAYFQLNKVDLAKAEFEKALRAAPALAMYSPEILFPMGETFMATREYARARDAYAMQIKRFPDAENNPFVMTRIAETYYLEKDFDKAVAAYVEVVGKHPDTETSAISLLRLADLAVERPEDARGKWGREIPALRDPLGTYRRIGEKGGPRALAELAWLRLGEELLRRKQHKEAIEAFRTMVDKYPDGRLYGRALFGLEEALVGRIDQKYRDQHHLDVVHLFHSEQDRGLKGLIRVAPLIQVAGSYQQLGLFEKADEALARADVSKATPREREDIQILKIESLQARGRWEALEPELRAYLRTYPQGRIRTRVARSLAEVLVRNERWEEAERFLKQASLEAREGLERARMEYLLARVYTHGERYAMAVDSLRRAIRMTPESKTPSPFLADTFYLLGDNLMTLGQYTEAAAVLKEGAARFPKDTLRGWALFEAGRALWRVGEAEMAEKTLNDVSAGQATGFWRRMAQAMKEDMGWWRKHEQLQN